jgi:hypothetical protein
MSHYHFNRELVDGISIRHGQVKIAQSIDFVMQGSETKGWIAAGIIIAGIATAATQAYEGEKSTTAAKHAAEYQQSAIDAQTAAIQDATAKANAAPADSQAAAQAALLKKRSTSLLQGGETDLTGGLLRVPEASLSRKSLLGA